MGIEKHQNSIQLYLEVCHSNDIRFELLYGSKYVYLRANFEDIVNDVELWFECHLKQHKEDVLEFQTQKQI